jgi:hypothetical protein
MIKKTFLLAFFLCYANATFSQQSASNFTYVIVPEEFSFLYGTDQYQLNSLTKFLFNKYGFNAYFPSELPNVKRCDGLQAEVLANSNFIYTKLTVVLKDCYGNEIFRGKEGKSKFKEYRKAYHQAIREAFESVEALRVVQKPPVDYDNGSGNSLSDSDMKEINPQQMGTVNNETEFTTSTGTKIAGGTDMNLPSGKFSSYVSNGLSFLLRKTENGYLLYEETESAQDGLLLKGSLNLEGNSVFYNSEEGERATVVFGQNKDFKIISNGVVQEFKKAN